MSGQYAQAQKSMEDILSSIRETIEEDIKEGRRWTNTPFGPTISPVSSTDSNVLDLTQVVNDDGSLTTLTPAPFAGAISDPVQDTFAQKSIGTPDLFLVEEEVRRTAFFGKKALEQEPTFSSLTPENVMIFPAFQTPNDHQDVPSFEKTLDQNQVNQSPYISLQTPTPKQDFYYVAPEAQMPQMQVPAFIHPHEEAPIMQSSPSKAVTPEILLNAEIEVNSIQRALEGEVCEEEAQEVSPEEIATVQEELPQEELADQELAVDQEVAVAQEELPDVQEEVAIKASTEIETVVESLISQETAEASSQALSALARSVIEQKMQQKELTPTEKFGQQTVDELMQAILRPMLKEWLDAHLPSLVKWIVTEQIEKVMQQGLSSDKSTS